MVIVYDRETGEEDKYTCSVEDALISSAMMKRNEFSQLHVPEKRRELRAMIRTAQLGMARNIVMHHLGELTAWVQSEREG